MVRKMGGWRKSGGGRAGNFWDAYNKFFSQARLSANRNINCAAPGAPNGASVRVGLAADPLGDCGCRAADTANRSSIIPHRGLQNEPAVDAADLEAFVPTASLIPDLGQRMPVAVLHRVVECQTRPPRQPFRRPRFRSVSAKPGAVGGRRMSEKPQSHFAPTPTQARAMLALIFMALTPVSSGDRFSTIAPAAVSGPPAGRRNCTRGALRNRRSCPPNRRTRRPRPGG